MSSSTGSRSNSMTGYKPSFNVGKAKGGYQPAQLQQFSPEQMNLFKNLFGHVGQDSFLSKLASGDQGTFDQLEAPALQQFAGVQGNIASRFSGMGSGARRSSGFQNTMNQASSDFAQQLQSQRMGLQQGAIRDLMDMSNQLLNQRPYENMLIEQKKKPGFFGSLFGGLLPAAGAAAGGIYGGVPGAKVGATVGGAASQGYYR